MRASLHLSSTALLNNFRIIGKKIPNLKLLPMVKANAYGHGAPFAVKTLMREKQLQGFGVATFEEAIEVRQTLKSSKIPVLVFSDSAPWTESHLKLCQQFALEPVFSEILSLLTFQKQKNFHTIKAHVEVNTGMNRLGIPPESLSLITFIPTSVFTHLADADLPHSKLTQKQIKEYEQVVNWVHARFPHALLHFANSSAIWNARHFPLLTEMNFARPGLSLYGIRPFQEAKEDGLKRVMTFKAPILNRIFLQKGDQVGYGGTYQCKNPKGEWIAVLAAGYADGVFRSLSGRGLAIYHEGSRKATRLQFRGRVSMDLIAIQGLSKMQAGETVELWGDSIDPYEQASLAETIPYELTTRVGERVKRFYE